MSPITNLQGDVVRLVNETGVVQAQHLYDAWGTCATFANKPIGQLNPLRYRSYVYDQETGLYYLQSRYYDPVVGRFINADNYPSTGQGFTGNNMFAYCGNNPVGREDGEGDFWLTSFIVGVASQYVEDVINNVIDGKSGLDIFKPTSSAGDYFASGVTALIPGSGLGAALTRNVVERGITVVEDIITGEDVNLVNSAVNVGIGTLLDVGIEKVANKVDDYIKSKQPKNYSSYAGKVRKENPKLTYEQIFSAMQRAQKRNNVARKVASADFFAIRAALPDEI